MAAVVVPPDRIAALLWLSSSIVSCLESFVCGAFVGVKGKVAFGVTVQSIV